MAVQAAFLQPGRYAATPRKSVESTPPPARGKNWDAILKDNDDEDTGGGGTIRGNRGKNAVHAAAALKRLTRAGRR